MDDDDLVYPQTEEGYRQAMRVSLAKARITLARIHMGISTIIWLLCVIAGLLFLIFWELHNGLG